MCFLIVFLQNLSVPFSENCFYLDFLCFSVIFIAFQLFLVISKL